MSLELYQTSKHCTEDYNILQDDVAAKVEPDIMELCQRCGLIDINDGAVFYSHALCLPTN